MRGKDKCKALKEIRAKIAEENDIEYVVSECKHKGDCKGTCPKCEAELIYLEKELEKRRNLGKRVCVTGLAVGMAATISGCTPMDVIDPVVEFFGGGVGTEDLAGAAEPYSPEPIMGEEAAPPEELDGDVEYIPEDSELPSDEQGSEEGSEEGGEEGSEKTSDEKSSDEDGNKEDGNKDDGQGKNHVIEQLEGEVAPDDFKRP